MNIAKQIISLELITFYESTPNIFNGSLQFCLQVFITKVIVTTNLNYECAFVSLALCMDVDIL